MDLWVRAARPAEAEAIIAVDEIMNVQISFHSRTSHVLRVAYCVSYYGTRNTQHVSHQAKTFLVHYTIEKFS